MSTTTTMAVKELLNKIILKSCPKDYDLKNTQEFCDGNRNNCKDCWDKALKNREVELVEKIVKQS